MRIRATVAGVGSRIRFAVLLCLLVAACSANGDVAFDRPEVDEATVLPEPGSPDPVSPEAVPPEPSATAIASAPEPTARPQPPESVQGVPLGGLPASDRIVVATGSGQVYLIDPDGQQRLDLSPAGGLQPVWSPDGRRIAWSQIDPAGFSIASVNADGSEPRRAQTLFSGYFGYWSPTSRSLGFLGNAPPGTGLVLDAGTGSDLDSVVDSDTFYYFSWSPDGTQWVVHSGSGLSIVTLDGNRTPLALEPGRFRAPTWANDGSILLALRRDDRNVIVRLDPDSGAVEELLEVGDVTNFVLDPTGRYLAVESVVLEAGEVDPGNGITASTNLQPTSLQPDRSGSEVLIYDMNTSGLRPILAEQTGGFWWSPDGETLAILVQEHGPAPEFAQWLFWGEDESFRSERFRITPALAGAYVPFFDQFAQSVTPWSPDSSRFVYSAFDVAGEPGVFVQTASANTPAQRISDDAGIAFWSPT